MVICPTSRRQNESDLEFELGSKLRISLAPPRPHSLPLTKLLLRPQMSLFYYHLSKASLVQLLCARRARNFSLTQGETKAQCSRPRDILLQEKSVSG